MRWGFYRTVRPLARHLEGKWEFLPGVMDN